MAGPGEIRSGAVEGLKEFLDGVQNIRYLTHAVSGALAIDCTTNFGIIDLTVNANVTAITLTNLTLVRGRERSFVLYVRRASVGNTFAFGSAFEFPGGTPPTLTNAANIIDVFTIQVIPTNVANPTTYEAFLFPSGAGMA
jgi:hypothetical protein